MYFLIACTVALIGMMVILGSVRPKPNHHRQPLINTDAWIDAWEFSIQKFLRKILRTIVVHLVSWYRFIIYDMNVHKNIRQKVRELLYEHYREEKRNKSALSQTHEELPPQKNSQKSQDKEESF